MAGGFTEACALKRCMRRRDRGLKTWVRNQTAELHMTREWMDVAKGSGMSFATRGTIMKPLHPDTSKHMSGAGHLAGTELEAALDASCKAFTGWVDARPGAVPRERPRNCPGPPHVRSLHLGG